MTTPDLQTPTPSGSVSPEMDRRIRWALAMLQDGALDDYYSAYGLS